MPASDLHLMVEFMNTSTGHDPFNPPQNSGTSNGFKRKYEERGERGEGRGERGEGRGEREEGRGKREEGRGKREGHTEIPQVPLIRRHIIDELR